MLYLHHRTVPFSTLVHVVFGNTYSVMGTIFIAFSWIFCVVFLSRMDLTSFSFSDDSPMTTGVVTQVEMTGSSENKRKIYAYHYTYTIGNQSFSGVSYESGGYAEAGDSVQVQYLTDKPEVSRIEGMRSSEFDMWVLLVLIFPIVGGVMTWVGLKDGFKGLRLLKHGELTTGKLINSELTNTRINNRPVYKMTFEFTTTEGKRQEAVAKTHEVELLQDEAQERILYLPDRSDIAMVLDEMKGSPRLDSLNPNQWYSMNGFKAFLYLLPTIIFLVELIFTFL